MNAKSVSILCLGLLAFQVSASDNPFILNSPPNGWDELNEPGYYVKTANTSGPAQILGLMEAYKPMLPAGSEANMDHPFWGCEKPTSGMYKVVSVTAGSNKFQVSEFSVKDKNGVVQSYPFDLWNSAMPQYLINSASSLIKKGATLKLTTHLCGNGGVETLVGIERIH